MVKTYTTYKEVVKLLKNDEIISGYQFTGINFRESFAYKIFKYCTFTNCKFIDTHLTRIIFYQCQFDGCTLSGTHLSGCDIMTSKFSNCILKDLDLHSTAFNLQERGCELINVQGNHTSPFVGIVCPEEGSFVAYKKVNLWHGGLDSEIIVKLLIPEDALRSSASSLKCRASKAKVIGFINMIGTEVTLSEGQCACSSYDPSFVYRLGETIEVRDFDKDRWSECSTGIHFFINKQVAMTYEI